MPGFALVVPPTDLESAKAALRSNAPAIAERCRKGQLVYAACRYGTVGVTLRRYPLPASELVQGASGLEILFWPQIHTTDHVVVEAIERFRLGDPDTDHRAEEP